MDRIPTRGSGEVASTHDHSCAVKRPRCFLSFAIAALYDSHLAKEAVGRKSHRSLLVVSNRENESTVEQYGPLRLAR